MSQPPNTFISSAEDVGNRMLLWVKGLRIVGQSLPVSSNEMCCRSFCRKQKLAKVVSAENITHVVEG